jgi:hypothetical protein
VGDTWFPDNWTNTFLVKTAPDLPPPPLRVIVPNGGERWPLFTRQNVTWASDSLSGLIRIELNRNYPSGNWDILVDSTANDSTETVDVTGPLSNACRIRVSLIGDTIGDISNQNFAITTSAGVLRWVHESQPNDPLGVWNAGMLAEADTLTDTLRLKNFGTEAIMIFPPSELQSNEFSVASACDTLSLAPGEMSSCDVLVSYHPQVNGEHFDTLAIRTNAGNSDGNFFVRLPLAGQLDLAVGDGQTSVPKSFSLHPVFPNPFNATTVITYDLPQAGQVFLRVFDLLGREVRVLKAGYQEAGTYRAVFDGDVCTSGVYFVRLDAGRFSQTRRLMLLK